MKRIFILSVLIAFSLNACKDKMEQTDSKADLDPQNGTQTAPFFDISLAQWSLHAPMQSGALSPMHFAKKAADLNFKGIEYVSQLYTDEIEKLGFQTVVDSLKAESDKHGIENVLIMIDHEGDLAASTQEGRDQAVEFHKKWVDAAQALGCHSVRVNLFGEKDREAWKKASVDGLSKLSAYAKTKNINVLVENHGELSSNAALVVEVIQAVNMDNCGTLPDFGNFCLEREDGERWGTPCVKEYPIYQGIQEMMPFAKAVSAKAYNFDTEGQETKLDYQRILQIIKEAGYRGYIGIEYEGDLADPIEGINRTRDLLLTAAQKLK
ncbi:sugar phosphate isomerase/epimerase family protein [Croceiramulus getboli]|nr:sugar phosphate isomerase/epimerase [Flavobacteriaceae bacterium YJPT1-3]